MKQKTKDTLCKAITEVGYWQWWDEVEGDYMVEFGGVLLYDRFKTGKQSRTSTVALCFYDNAFLIFLDNKKSSSEYYVALHEDSMAPIRMDPDTMVFDDPQYASNLLTQFKHRHSKFNNKDAAVFAITHAKVLIAATCQEYGFIIGGNICEIQGRHGVFSDSDILNLSAEWWNYRESYWEKRETKDAYEYDYACELIKS